MIFASTDPLQWFPNIRHRSFGSTWSELMVLKLASKHRGLPVFIAALELGGKPLVSIHSEQIQ